MIGQMQMRPRKFASENLPTFNSIILVFQVCDDCPKTFGAERSLRIHTLQVHQTELICDKCAKNFGTDHKKFLRHLQRAHITEVISRVFLVQLPENNFRLIIFYNFNI